MNKADHGGHEATTALIGLALLSRGSSKYDSSIEKIKNTLVRQADRMQKSFNWNVGYSGIFLAEYYLRTEDRAVLEAMSEARFSLFEVAGRHTVAGLVLQDVLTGEDMWLIDDGLEASAPEGCRLSLRVFRPGDFWMTTGAAIVLTGDGMRDAVNRCRPAPRNGDLPAETVDPDGLAEAVYASVIASEGGGRVASL